MPTEAEVKQVAEAIKHCESGGRYDAQNPKSTASGAYQFLDGTWANYKGFRRAKDAPPAVQDEKFLETYARSGLRPWNASKRCWGNRIPAHLHGPAGNLAGINVGGNLAGIQVGSGEPFKLDIAGILQLDKIGGALKRIAMMAGGVVLFYFALNIGARDFLKKGLT